MEELECYICKMQKQLLHHQLSYEDTKNSCSKGSSIKDFKRQAAEEDAPERIWAWIFAGRQFHKGGRAEAKAHSCEVKVLDRGKRSLLCREQSGQSEIADRAEDA